MSASYDFNGLVPPARPDPKEAARKGLYNANIIAEIMQSLGAADITGSRPICGTMLGFLADQLTVALGQIEEGARL